jgi:glycosyltransferase involved in cell wall biosynthesis
VAEVFRSEGPRYEPGEPYFLFVGRREAHKNLARLVAGYAASRARKSVRLVFAGPADPALLALARRNGVEGRVAFTAPLADAELAACYRGALALAFPSLYEGFGLPIAEAMACGTPVLTSGVTAIPETVGDGTALIVDPLRVEAIADGLDRVAEDAALRARLRERGLQRAGAFSWQVVAEKTADILRQAEASG